MRPCVADLAEVPLDAAEVVQRVRESGIVAEVAEDFGGAADSGRRGRKVTPQLVRRTERRPDVSRRLWPPDLATDQRRLLENRNPQSRTGNQLQRRRDRRQKRGCSGFDLVDGGQRTVQTGQRG